MTKYEKLNIELEEKDMKILSALVKYCNAHPRDDVIYLNDNPNWSIEDYASHLAAIQIREECGKMISDPAFDYKGFTLSDYCLCLSDNDLIVIHDSEHDKVLCQGLVSRLHDAIIDYDDCDIVEVVKKDDMIGISIIPPKETKITLTLNEAYSEMLSEVLKCENENQMAYDEEKWTYEEYAENLLLLAIREKYENNYY